MKLGAIILCGGKSSRMGMPKAELPYGDETMLNRVARLLANVADPIVIVVAKGQPRPHVAVPCRFAEDANPDRGPLEGLAAGIREIGRDADAAYVTSCDAPLLATTFVSELAARLERTNANAAAPWDGEFLYPLSAVYRTNILPTIDHMLAANRLRPTELLQELSALRVPTDDLRAADPNLNTLRNLNLPEDYLAALNDLGLSASPEVIAALRREPQSNE